MIYKFIDLKSTNALEVAELEDMVSLTIYGDGEQTIDLEPQQLYKLIGALHSIQSNLKKEGGQNG